MYEEMNGMSRLMVQDGHSFKSTWEMFHHCTQLPHHICLHIKAQKNEDLEALELVWYGRPIYPIPQDILLKLKHAFFVCSSKIGQVFRFEDLPYCSFRGSLLSAPLCEVASGMPTLCTPKFHMVFDSLSASPLWWVSKAQITRSMVSGPSTD